jgi:fungalysin metallopeptidase (M36)
MPINFIPNDPLAGTGPVMRRKTARPNRAAGVAGFSYITGPAAGLYTPGTADFLFWQAREAALAAVQTYEDLSRQKVKEWARSSPRQKLDLLPDEGTDLNAYYNGQSLSFFEYQTGNKTTYSGASTDVVAHEAGHALLDQARPDLWFSNYPETNAFHEAFGDMMALLTAFSDRKTRDAVRKDMRKSNFVEATAEDLSDGVLRKLGASHPAAKPRHARNNFRWALPSTLPTSGSPSVLSAEIHSFARVFTGCFYDTILNILRDTIGAGKAPSQAQLRQAVRTAGSLVIRGAAEAPESARFFQSVGRTMILADEAMNGGANRTAIHDAFDRHGIALGSSAMLAPTAALAGKAPSTRRGARQPLGSAALADLRGRLGADPKAKMVVRTGVIGGQPVVRATHMREVPLGQIDSKLKGVVAIVPEPILVGSANRTAAILGELPESTASTNEVATFVQTLLDSNRIAFDRESARRGIKSAIAGDDRTRLPTHAVRETGGRKVLERVRFACGG